jgi:ferritin-like metal-binding protein YciE
MKNQDLYQLFIEELEDVYSAEQQIIDSLPRLIKIASLPELKEALTKHLEETKYQVTRIEKIFSILDTAPEEITCEAMEGLLSEAEKVVENKNKSPVLDAAIISAAQKVEHYEIASYGTLRSFAKHLNFDQEIIDLLQESLDEEGAADKKLTKIADGSFFFNGINKEAAEAGPNYSRKIRK